MKPERRGRVVESHTIARAAVRAGGLFAVVSAIWSVTVLIGGGSWWGPLHAFLAGTVLLIISGASQMFTITWAAAPAPSPGLTTAQRWSAVLGTACVLTGVSLTVPALVWAGAAALATALLLLGWSIRRSVLRSLLRRFDLSSRFYLLAVGCAVAGVGLGALLATGTGEGWGTSMRLVHSHLNLVGFVGFTIIGTLPTFLPTVAHHRAVSGREAAIAWWMCAGAAAAMLAGLAAGPAAVGAGTLGTGVAAALVLTGVLSRLWERGRGRPAFVQLAVGVGWLCAWTVVDGARLLSGAGAVPFGPWTGAVVLAGVGQVLAGSLAYLLPVLTGPPLEDNARRMTGQAWLPLLTANLAGVAMLTGRGTVAALLASVWVVDFGRRIVSLRR